jgi:hypothetical protein
MLCGMRATTCTPPSKMNPGETLTLTPLASTDWMLGNVLHHFCPRSYGKDNSND